MEFCDTCALGRAYMCIRRSCVCVIIFQSHLCVVRYTKLVSRLKVVNSYLSNLILWFFISLRQVVLPPSRLPREFCTCRPIAKCTSRFWQVHFPWETESEKGLFPCHRFHTNTAIEWNFHFQNRPFLWSSLGKKEEVSMCPSSSTPPQSARPFQI